jgi:outer membrane receptor protein involved in Fe transport
MRYLGLSFALAMMAGAVVVHAQEPEIVDETSEDPARPPPAGMGVVHGQLVDAQSGEALIEAEVTELASGKKTLTDIDGFYRLELPPGSYDLRFWYELHQARQVRGVRVQAGAVVKVDERLSAMEGSVDVVKVETEADTASTEGQLLGRKRAAAVGDSVGRAEIARTPDRNAAEAAKRVVGANVVGDRFVFVRGLGERYTNALLDGAPLPSPEPDRQTVPLDLFPAMMLENITIAKTFTPDVPGDFAGGSVQIQTRRLPTRFTIGGSLGVGINSQSTFRDSLTYRGSNMDFLGIDGGVRRLPPDIPDYKIDNGLPKDDGTKLGQDEVDAYGKSINAFMSNYRHMTPPDHGGSLVVGYGFEPYTDGRMGVMGAVTYGRSFEVREDEELRNFGIDPTTGELLPLNDLRVERGIDKVRWGTLGGFTWEMAPGQRIHLTGLYSRSADNQAIDIEGHHDEKGATIHETRLSFVSRALSFGQIRGEHELTDLAGAKLAWNASLAQADRDEPDTRAAVFQLDSTFGFLMVNDAQSGLHFFSDQGERTIAGGMDWTQPLEPGDKATSLKLGTSMSLRDRDFNARRFHFAPKGKSAAYTCAVFEWDPKCPNGIFLPDKIGPSLDLVENTRGNDEYDATLNVFAGYAMVDAWITDELRLVAGERIESSHQSIHSFDPWNPEANPIDAELDDTDFLPAASLTWAVLPQANLRLSATRTLARPQLREFAPFAFTDFFGGREVQGNPDLENTRIYNGDVRFEWFPSAREVLAASFFFKRFEAPIEQVITSSGARGTVTFQNAEGANLAGVELEARKNFDFIAEELRDLGIGANLTLAYSRVQLDPEAAAFVTSKARPLSNQTPFITNVSVFYENEDIGFAIRVLYNVSGRSIAQVGTQGLPDVYEQPRHQLDASAAQRLFEGFELKLNGTNLVNSPVRFTQGSDDDDANVIQSYRRGIGLNLTAAYTY